MAKVWSPDLDPVYRVCSRGDSCGRGSLYAWHDRRFVQTQRVERIVSRGVASIRAQIAVQRSSVSVRVEAKTWNATPLRFGPFHVYSPFEDEDD